MSHARSLREESHADVADRANLANAVRWLLCLPRLASHVQAVLCQDARADKQYVTGMKEDVGCECTVLTAHGWGDADPPSQGQRLHLRRFNLHRRLRRRTTPYGFDFVVESRPGEDLVPVLHGHVGYLYPGPGV